MFKTTQMQMCVSRLMMPAVLFNLALLGMVDKFMSSASEFKPLRQNGPQRSTTIYEVGQARSEK